jgi:hypothetical protein
VDPDLADSLLGFTSYVSVVPEPALLARLHHAGLLSEPDRLEAIERMAHLAVHTPDDGWINGSAWKILLTPADRAILFDKVRTELVPRLDTGEAWGDERDGDDDPVDSTLFGYEMAFEDEGDAETAQAFAEARDAYSQLPIKAGEDYLEMEDRLPLANTRVAPAPNTSRSIFDDIDSE